MDCVGNTSQVRHHYDFTSHLLLGCNPHDYARWVEYYAFRNPEKPIPKGDKILSTHMPYESLPEGLRRCRIVYVSRDPKDNFVSLWHFINKMQPRKLALIPLKEAFDLFCEGISPNGPYWEHVLGYWNASLKFPEDVLFLKYKDMKTNTINQVKKLANFIRHPFTMDEERGGVIESIVSLCSFENLKKLEVNQRTKTKPIGSSLSVANNMFFRRGTVGDHKDCLTIGMIERMDNITKEKFQGSGLII